MSPSSLTVKQKLANGFVIFTAIWSSVIMPVVPAYAKMLDNKELPSLGSDQIINEDNTERLVAEHTKTVGTFLSQKKTMKDLSEMAQDYARNKVASEATKEIEHWLSKAGNVKLNIDIDKKFSVKNSQFDWLIPWYDQAEFLLFTQHSLHRYDERFHTNNGIGLRHFHEKSTIGMNAFIDHDFSHAHTRAGLGVEYWQDYLKLNANSYFGLTAWKSAPELNHDYNAKPAHGWDIQIEGWLPAYPHLGGNLKYEQYYGDSVALFGKTKRQKNPNAATIGANWTPFPLFTLNASHKLGSEKRSETQAKLQFTWTFGKSLAHHLDPTKVAEARRLSGNRYDFVERNNNIILNYQKKTLLHLSLPTKIQGVTGQSVPLVKSFTGKYPLKHIEWQAPEFLAAGGLISSTDQTATLTLPSYKTSKTAKDTQKINRYRLRATAYDVKDNASPVAETLIEITHSGAVSISPRDMKFHGKGLANGHDVNRLTAIVRDSLGNPVSNAKVVFVLPNTLTLASQKKKSAANSSVQNSLRKKMQAMKISKPWEYIATTDDKGEAQVQFTSQIAGSYEISAYSSNQQPVKAQATFIPDVAQAYIHNFTVSRAGVIADGVSTHSVQAHITDKNKNSIANQEVTFSATHAKIVDKATTDKNGLVEVTLTSLKAGPSEVTLSVNGHSETKTVEFISGKLHQVTILDVPEVYAGRESQVSFQLLDSHGNPIIDAKNDITVIIDKKAVSEAISHTDINNGIYAAKTLGQQPGEHTIQVVMDKLISPERTFITRDALSVKSATTDGSGPAGALGVIASIEIDINPNRTDFKSGDNPLVIATLKDSFGNEIENIDPKNIHFVNLKGKNLGWRQNGNYDYAINLPLTTIGDIDITTHVNGIYSPKTILTVSRNSGISNIQNVVVTPTNKTPNAGDIPTLTVKLTDNSGNPVNDIQQLDVTIGGTPHALPATQNPDGSYTVELPAQHSGDKQVQVTVNGQPSNTATLSVNAPKPITNTTTGKAGEQGVLDKLTLSSGTLSNLKSGDTLALTVTATDAFKNPLTGLASAITFAHAQAGTVTWKDNQDGTYSGTLALSKLGADTLTAAVNKVSSKAITLTVNNAAGNTHVHSVVVTPTNTTPNAGDIPTLKVELTDSNGNVVNGITQLDVTIGGTPQTLPATQNKDGSYTVTLPAQHSGQHDLQVTVNGQPSNTATLTVNAPKPITTNTAGKAGEQGVLDNLTLSSSALTNLKSGDTLALTVTAQDAFKNPLTGLASTITLTHAQAGAVTWKDNQDGTYTASLALSKLGSDNLTATINKVNSKPLTLTVNNAAGNTHVHNVVVTPTNKTPNAGDIPTLKVELTDSNGNVVNGITQLDVTIGGTPQTLPATQNKDGSYTVELPAQHSGQHDIQVTVNGQPSNTATLSVNAPKPITNTTGKAGEQGVLHKLTLSSGALSNLKSGDTLALTVTATDAFKNPLTGLASAITLTHAQAGNVTWTDNKDGTYSGTLSLSKLGADTLTATINKVSSQAVTLTVNNAAGNTHVHTVVVTPTNTTPNAGDIPTLKVELTDSNGNVVNGITQLDVTIGGTPQTLPATQNKDGSYTVELPAQHSGKHDLKVTVNGQPSNTATLTVNAPKPITNTTGKAGEKGVLDSLTLSSGTLTNLKSGDTLALTVTAQDAFKNPLTGLASTITLTHAQAGTVTWKDNQDGTYSGTLALSKLGADTLTATINKVSSQAVTLTVNNAAGNTHVHTVVVTPTNTTPNAGDIPTLKVELTDSNGNVVNGITQLDVTIGGTPQTLPATQNKDGSYTVELPAQHSGKHDLQVTVNGQPSNNATLSVNAPKPITTNTTGKAGEQGVLDKLTLSSGALTNLKSGDTLALTVTVQDTFKNPLTGLTSAITIAHAQAGNVTWTDNKDGTYSGTLSLSKLGADTLTATINKVSSQAVTLTVNNAAGNTHVHTVVVTPTNTTPNAGDIPTLTVKLTDNNGNTVNDVKHLDVTIGGTPHALPATQNPDGSYTVTLPAQHSGKHDLQVTVNGQLSNTTTLTVNAPKPITNTTTGKAGEQGVLDSLTLSSGTLTNLKSGDTLALTVEAQDAFKNPLTGLASTITLTHAQAGTVTWTDNQDGTYTASLVLSKLGSDSLTAAINKVNSKPLTLTVNNAAGNTHVHNVVVTPTNKTPNAGDIPTLKVELTDSNGNVVNGITQLDVTIGGTPQTLPATQNKDGSYTVELPAQHSGQHDIQVTVNGQPSNTATLTVNTPKPITNTTGKAGEQGVLDSLTLSSGTLTNLKSGDTLALTVTAQDAFKNPLTGLASTITLTHAQAGTVTWTDNQDGTYTASLPLTKLGADTLTATINKVSSKAISVNVANLTGHAGVQNVVVTPTNTTPNAGDIPTLKVELTDSNGNVVNGITQLDVTIGGTPHALPATQNPDGSYTVTLPAQHSGKQDIQVTVNGQPSNTATLTVNAPKPITNTTGKAGEQGVLDSLTLSSGTLTNLKSGDTLALTVTAQDAFKNPLTGLASTITLTHAQAGTVTWTDNQDGTYTASLPLTKLGADTLTATINKVSSKAISVNVANLTGHAGVQNVAITPTNTTPNAGDIPTLTVKLTDNNGNTVNDVKHLDVTIGGTPHALPATQNPDGSYTVTLPAQHSGKHDLQVTVNGQLSNTTTLTVNAPKPITNTSTGKAGEQGVLDKLTLSSGALTNLKSGDTLALTVEAQDAFKNPLTGLASTITLTHAQAGAVTWKDNQDGTYTASLALSKLGSDSLTAAINKISSKPITINVANLTGHAGVQNVAITPTNTTPNAGDIPTLTVKLTDNNGNTVNDVKHLDVTIGGTPHALPATQNPDGSYTVTLPAQHSGKQDIQVTVNGQPSNNATLSVNAPKPITTNTTGKAGEQGVLDKLTLSSGALTNLKSGDTLALTVTVQDTFKNPLTGLASTITLTHAQAGTVTWTDNKDGTYSGTLSLSKLGADTLTAAVGTNRSQDISITVEPQNSQKFVTAVKLQTQHPQISAGEKATIILTLHDKYQNGVVQISSNDIKLEDNKLALSNIQWQEQGNGVYITELPLSQLGNHKLISTVNFLETPAIDVDVTALRGAIRVHHVSLDATPKQFVVGQKVQLTLTLLDQFNNGVMDVLTNEININDDNTRSSLSGLQWHYQQNGVYIADTIITKGGVHSLKATVNSKQHSVLVNAITSVGQKQVSDALLTTNTASITAGSSVTLTLELKDQHDNSVSQVDSSDIVLTNNSGASIPTTWVEMSNLGVYTTKTQLNTVGDQTLTMTVNSISRNIDLHVTSPHGASSVAQLKVSPIKAVEAGQISSLIVAMKDQYGNAVNNVLNRDVAIEIDGVAHSIQLTELGDSGQYTGQLPALLKGQHTVKITVNGQVETSNWTINNPIAIPLVSFDKTEQRGALEKMTLRSNKKSVGSGEKAILTLNLMDKFDNPLTGASSHLRLLTNLKETSNWQDNHDGSYSIELLMNRLGSQAVQAIVKNQLSKSVDLDISALSGASSVNTTALTIKDAVIEAGDTTELTLLLKDSVDNGVINIQDSDIHLTQNNAKLKKNWSSTVNGLYTTPLQINQVGVYPLRAIINQQNSRIETIEVTDPTGHTKVANAKLTTNITSLEAGKSVELTLELKDQYNNLVKGVNGVNITLNDSHASETIDSNQIAWRMDSVGIYKASLPLLRTGKHTLQVTVNHQKAQTSEITVNALKGAVNISKIELTSAKNTISAGEKTTLTLKMQDRFGNEVDNVSVADIELKNTDAQVTTQATWVKVPTTLGTYTTGIQLNNVKSHTLIAKVNGQTQTVQIDVTPQKGASHVAALTLQVPATTEVAEKTKLTLTLTDQFGNNVIAVENQHIELMLGSTRQNVTWIEAQDGTYQADLTLNQVGNHTITVGVNTLSGTKSLHVNSPSGKDHVASIQLSVTANPALPNASTKLTLTLKDKYGNGVKDIRSADISLSDSHLPENFVSPTWAEESSQTGVYTALVNLKKVADHTLTASLNNIDKTIKVTVQPFAEAQQVNDIELSVDNKNIIVDGKVTFTLTTKDIYGNNVSIKAADIQMQNANGALNQPTWTMQGEQHKGELILSLSGDYVITAHVGTKVSSPVKVTVKAGSPVFAAGKSEFSVNSDAIDEGSNTNVVVTLVLKDANGNLIKKKKPRVSANKGTITGTMNEIRDGVYTSNFNNPVIGISTISLDRNSIDYAGTTPTISVVTYGKLEIKTIDYAHTFSVNDKFPHTGFVGAQFQIIVPIGKQTDYNWSVDIDWLSIDEQGIVTMLRKPTPIKNGNAMIPIFKGVPKANTGYKRTVDYRFTLKKWYFNNKGKLTGQAAMNACQAPSRLIARDDLLTSGLRYTVPRKAGERVFHEWNSLHVQNKLSIKAMPWLADGQTATSATQVLNPFTNEIEPIRNSTLEMETICVEDLK